MNTFSTLGLEQNKGCNFDSFMRTSSSPSKRGPKQKHDSNQPDWNSIPLAQQYEILHNLSNENARVVLDFEALSLALKTAKSSTTLKKAFQLEGGNDQSPDQDEQEYLKELLEEQAERSEKILELEEKRLDHEMTLLQLKNDLAQESVAMRKAYAKLMQMDPDDDVAPAFKKKALDSQAIGSIIEQKSETLKAEEDRVTEMK